MIKLKQTDFTRHFQAKDLSPGGNVAKAKIKLNAESSIGSSSTIGATNPISNNVPTDIQTKSDIAPPANVKSKGLGPVGIVVLGLTAVLLVAIVIAVVKEPTPKESNQ